MNETTIGREIERRMIAMGMNRKELSLKAGLGATYVRDVLTGKSRNPRRDLLDKIANALGCSVIELYEGKITEALSRNKPQEIYSEAMTNEIVNAIAFAESHLGEKAGNTAFELFIESFSIWSKKDSNYKIDGAQFSIISMVITGVFSTLLDNKNRHSLLVASVFMIDTIYQLTRRMTREEVLGLLRHHADLYSMLATALPDE